MSSASPDLSALASVNGWEHFGTVEAPAMLVLRGLMGDDYASAPGDSALQDALDQAVEYLQAATGRIFTGRAGVLSIDGTGSHRLFLPQALISTNQDAAGGIVEILIGDDTTALDSDTYQGNDGIGLSPNDPRDHPFIDLVAAGSGGSFVSRPPGFGGWRAWSQGVRNIHVEALWGYVDANGATPLLARKALAGLTVRALTDWDDQGDLDDLHLGAVQSEVTRDRSVTYGERAGGGGITTNRELDLLIARLRGPRAPRVPRPPGRRIGNPRNALLSPVRSY